MSLYLETLREYRLRWSSVISVVRVTPPHVFQYLP